MALDAAQLLAALQQAQEANAPKLPQMAGLGGQSSRAYGPRTAEEIEGMSWLQGRNYYRKQNQLATAAALDEQDRVAAAEQAQFQSMKPGAMGLSQRELIASGIDPAEGARIGRAMYGAETPEQMAAAQAMAQMSMADPALNPGLAAEQQLAQRGQFGSGIQDYQTFQTVAEPLAQAYRGAENVGFIADTVEALTPAQINANGKLKGQLQSSGYQLLSAMQSLSENKASTLREGERKMIEDFLGNPEGLIGGIFSRDEVTLGKLRSLEDAFSRNVEGGLVGLDDTTRGYLSESALKANPSLARFRTPEGTIRIPERPESTKTKSTPEEAQTQTIEALPGQMIW